MNNPVCWISVDKDESEWMFTLSPIRVAKIWEPQATFTSDEERYLRVPKGTAKKLTGKDMTWADEPRRLYDE